MLADGEEGFLEVPVIAQVDDQAAGRVFTDTGIAAAQGFKPSSLFVGFHAVQLDELLKQIVFERAGADSVYPGTFFDHGFQLAVTDGEVEDLVSLVASDLVHRNEHFTRYFSPAMPLKVLERAKLVTPYL